MRLCYQNCTTSEVEVNSSVQEFSSEESSLVGESEPEEVLIDYFPKQELTVPESIKILAIGNSFSVDAMTYLYQFLEDAGVQEIVLGNLYMGGCSIKQHADNVQLHVAAYTYYKNTNGTWTQEPIQKLEYELLDEDWDIITMQQASGVSGKDTSYSRLKDLIKYVNENKTNPDAKLWWHMTWVCALTGCSPSDLTRALTWVEHGIVETIKIAVAHALEIHTK